MKYFEKLKTKFERTLISKNLKLKQKIKQLELDKTNLIKDKRELQDIITLQENSYRELDLKLRGIKNKLNKNELFQDLMEVLNIE